MRVKQNYFSPDKQDIEALYIITCTILVNLENYLIKRKLLLPDKYQQIGIHNSKGIYTRMYFNGLLEPRLPNLFIIINE